MPPLAIPMLTHHILTLNIQTEHDVVLARQRAAQIAALAGFGNQDQSRIATAVSEIARNAFEYAHGGSAVFQLREEQRTLEICIRDRGTGITALEDVLSGDYQSQTGMGLGILGARRLMDTFRVESSTAGTEVVLGKELPRRVSVDRALLETVQRGLMAQKPSGLLEEVQNHNQEMLRAMEELQRQQEQLLQLNLELEDTNRGVVALYAELDEHAELLRKSNALKTRFLSNVSHELRTPLNAILSLSNLLLARADGPLTGEQEKQVFFIRRSAESLTDLVNDLLDLAKVEAGKVVIRAAEFEVEGLLGALRGMMRPLLGENSRISFVFEMDPDIGSLHTDEGKVAQILRNFISNAIKFTAEGEVKVTARLLEDDEVEFCVADTGIGIAPGNLEFVFQEFSQLENPMHSGTKGTGLGLPLARRLAQLLGGDVHVESQLGLGSKFYCVLPRRYKGEEEQDLVPETPDLPIRTSLGPGHDAIMVQADFANAINRALNPDSDSAREKGGILLVDNDPAHCYILRSKLGWTGRRIMEAHNGNDALHMARQDWPELIFLDLVMPEMDGFEVLRQLRADALTRDIPVIVHTSKNLSEGERRHLDEQGASVWPKAPRVSNAEAENQFLRRLTGPYLKTRHNRGGQ